MNVLIVNELGERGILCSVVWKGPSPKETPNFLRRWIFFCPPSGDSWLQKRTWWVSESLTLMIPTWPELSLSLAGCHVLRASVLYKVEEVPWHYTFKAGFTKTREVKAFAQSHTANPRTRTLISNRRNITSHSNWSSLAAAGIEHSVLLALHCVHCIVSFNPHDSHRLTDEKQRHREGEPLAQGHRDRKWDSWSSSSGRGLHTPLSNANQWSPVPRQPGPTEGCGLILPAALACQLTVSAAGRVPMTVSSLLQDHTCLLPTVPQPLQRPAHSRCAINDCRTVEEQMCAWKFLRIGPHSQNHSASTEGKAWPISSTCFIHSVILHSFFIHSPAYTVYLSPV